MTSTDTPASATPAAPYANLTPDSLLDALDGLGLPVDGRLLALNSFENRVYQFGLEDEGPARFVVAKFYRPARWSEAQILEEHAFVAELAERELPVVAPLVIDGRTLHRHGEFLFAVFPRRGGRAPEFDHADTLRWMGRFLGRIHAVGRLAPYRERPVLDIDSFGTEPRDWLLAHDFIPPELLEPWRVVAEQALAGVRACFERAGRVTHLRLHGDCHAGNVLWTEPDGPHFVDFDDSRMGPAVQDLWMLLSGERDAMERQLAALVAGYEEFCDFDRRELQLVEALRTLRLIHYSGWLARRWHDPAFPAAFPWFDTPRYWQDRILELREQVAAMQEPALATP